MNDITAGFIGLGLIGGSILRALKKTNPDIKTISYNRNKDKVHEGLSSALKEGTLNYITNDLRDGFDQCDVVFLCAPVLNNIDYLKELKDIIKPDCILTDVGSVKGNIHDAVTKLNLDHNFIGGHPMAGSEKTGYANSNEKLLENAYYILTPTKETNSIHLTFMETLVKETGAIPVILNAKEHDDITAAISHVPHIIAASLVTMVKNTDDDDEKMRLLAAGGFKDITRIASSSPIMWQNICLTNTDSISNYLDTYISTLESFKQILIKKEEAPLYNFFEVAGDYRNSIPNKSIGPIKRAFEVYVDIIDETGAIATIATILASNHVSIKNIGIIHNREFCEGVLRIELYNEESTYNTVELLKKYRYKVYQR